LPKVSNRSTPPLGVLRLSTEFLCNPVPRRTKEKEILLISFFVSIGKGRSYIELLPRES